MNRRVLSLILGSLLLHVGCGGNDDSTGPAYATLLVTTTSLPNADRRVAYSRELVASGGDSSYTWSVTDGSLPTLALTLRSLSWMRRICCSATRIPALTSLNREAASAPGSGSRVSAQAGAAIATTAASKPKKPARQARA